MQRSEKRLNRLKRMLMGLLVFLMLVSLLGGCGKKKSQPYVYKGVNILVNGDMEIGDPVGEFPLGWARWGQYFEIIDNKMEYGNVFKEGPLIEDISWVLVDGNDGNKCIKIETETGDVFLCIHQVVKKNIPVGKKIKLTVNIKTENLEGPGVAIALRCDGPEVNGQIQFSQFVTSQGTIPIKGTKDWTKYTVELDQKVRPGIETINVYLLYLEDTSGTVYFDDASLIY